MIGRLWVWVRLSRPHFLLGGFLMFGLGASTTRPVDGTDYLTGQLMVTMAQLTAHYANEYADVDADRSVEHRTAFSGGSGVLVDGSLPVRSALWAARVTSVVWLSDIPGTEDHYLALFNLDDQKSLLVEFVVFWEKLQGSYPIKFAIFGLGRTKKSQTIALRECCLPMLLWCCA